jgi:hypothetical protein
MCIELLLVIFGFAVIGIALAGESYRKRDRDMCIMANILGVRLGHNARWAAELELEALSGAFEEMYVHMREREQQFIEYFIDRYAKTDKSGNYVN